MDYWSFVIEGQVALVSPNRAAAPGSVNLAAVSELADLLDTLADLYETVRVVVITGDEGRFLGDVDREEFAFRLPGDGDDSGDHVDWYAWDRVRVALSGIPQPTVAAVDGEATGGGYVIALDCTLRIASARASFGPSEVDLGIVGTQGFDRLLRLVGPAVGAELLLTKRIVQADEAKRTGLVTEVLPAEGFSEQLSKWCESVASVPNVFEIKRILVGQDFVARSELWAERPWKGLASLVDSGSMASNGASSTLAAVSRQAVKSGDCGCHSRSLR